MFFINHMAQLELKSVCVLTLFHPKTPSFLPLLPLILLLLLLTLQVCPSSRAALWASTGLSMTRPVRPEKSIATREFSDTLRC